MKKAILFLIVICSSAYCAGAQETFLKRDKVISAGVGVGINDWSLGSDIYGSKFRVISGAFEYCAIDGLFGGGGSIGLGGVLNYESGKDSSVNVWVPRNLAVIGGQATCHYGFLKRVDAYGALVAGAAIAFGKTGGEESDCGSVDALVELRLGLRVYFVPRFAVYADYCLISSLLSVGLSFKI